MKKDKSKEDFFKEYKELCDKHGYIISVAPTLKHTDSGTWGIALNTSIVELPDSGDKQT